MGTPVKKTKYEVVAPASKYEVAPPSAPQNPDDQPHFSAAPQFPSVGWFKEKGYNIADKATNLLPAAGGIAGGLIGFGAGTVEPGGGNALGAVTGASIGGSAGEAGRQLLRRAIFPPSKGWESGIPKDSTEAAANIATEGMKQGAYELGGQGMRAIGRTMAPRLAEASVAPGKRLLKSIPEDAQPIGKTILKETTGIKPKTIAAQIDNKVAEHSAAADDVLAQAGKQGRRVPLAPARKIASDEIPVAINKNAPKYIQDVNTVADQLNTQYGPTGQAVGRLPDVVTPERARALRQGVDLTIGNWNPEAQAAIDPLRKRVYGAITGKLHDVVPEVVEHDKAMTNLIPAGEAARNTAFTPGLTRSTVERFARPTGALIGAGIGTEEGYRHGGIGGAVAGGLTGLVLPNAIASPEGLMTAARVVDSGIPSRVIRSAVPIGEGLAKPKASKKKRPGDSEGEEE